MFAVLLLFILQLSLQAQAQSSTESFRFTPPARPAAANTPAQNPAPAKPPQVKQQSDSVTVALAKAQRKIDSLIVVAKTQALRDSVRGTEVAAEFWRLNKDNYPGAVVTAFRIMGVWFLIMLGLLFYGLYRFHFTGGLGRQKYRQLVDEFDEDSAIPLHERVARYPQNPYKNETFGLPPGTVRGFLTLTLLIGNCLVLYVGHYAPPSWVFDQRVDFITTAFLMMIAFYFGSKAVDVLKEREESKRVLTPKNGKSAPAGAPPSRNVEASSSLIPAEAGPTTSLKQDFEHLASGLMAKSETEVLPLEKRVLALTAYFETGKKIEEACGVAAGNFDNMGLSFGCLQWNLGQRTLQPILKNYFAFGDGAWQNDANLKQLQEVLATPFGEQMRWALSIQERRDGKFMLAPNWKRSFEALGRATLPFQLQACEERFRIAKAWCTDWALVSERAFALMFDINVQNGALYRKDAARNIDVRRSLAQRIQNAGSPSEEQKLVIIAEERAKTTLPRWRKVVLDRKLTIARGRGKVYGVEVNLEDYDLRLDRPFA